MSQQIHAAITEVISAEWRCEAERVRAYQQPPAVRWDTWTRRYCGRTTWGRCRYATPHVGRHEA